MFAYIRVAVCYIHEEQRGQRREVEKRSQQDSNGESELMIRTQTPGDSTPVQTPRIPEVLTTYEFVRIVGPSSRIYKKNSSPRTYNRKYKIQKMDLYTYQGYRAIL